jgi:hypothetical protein
VRAGLFRVEGSDEGALTDEGPAAVVRACTDLEIGPEAVCWREEENGG